MKPNLLDHMKVAAPCHEDWNAMRGNDEVRFCSHCAKDVHNLSAMTRAGAEALIKKSGGRLCVRYVTRADKTIVTASPTAPLSNFTRRASKLAASAFTAALTFTPAANAQTSATVNQTTHAEATPNQQPAAQIGSGSVAITGTVLDPQGAVVPNANVALIDPSGTVRNATTSDEGIYRIKNLPSGTFTLRVEASGFTNAEMTSVNLSSGGENRVDVNLEVGETFVTVGFAAIASLAYPLVHHESERSNPSHEESPEDEKLSDAFNKAASDDLKDLKTLLKSGFDVNTRWVNGITPLMFVNEPNIARHLIQVGADVQACDAYGETTLMKARNPQVIKVLLKAGADVNARDNFGVTALMYAMLGYDEKSAQVLIDAGADVNARDKDNRTALMFAAIEGRAATIKILLAAKAAHDVRDTDGKTALRFAIENNQDEAVKVLREASAVE